MKVSETTNVAMSMTNMANAFAAEMQRVRRSAHAWYEVSGGAAPFLLQVAVKRSRTLVAFRVLID